MYLAICRKAFWSLPLWSKAEMKEQIVSVLPEQHYSLAGGSLMMHFHPPWKMLLHVVQWAWWAESCTARVNKVSVRRATGLRELSLWGMVFFALHALAAKMSTFCECTGNKPRWDEISYEEGPKRVSTLVFVPFLKGDLLQRQSNLLCSPLLVGNRFACAVL